MKTEVTTRPVGQSFGTVGIVRLGRRRVTGDVVAYGFDSAARRSALAAAVRAGLITESQARAEEPTY